MTAPRRHCDEAAARAAWRAWADGLRLQLDATDARQLVPLGDLLLRLTDATNCDRPAAVHRLADTLERTGPPLFIVSPGAPAAPADAEAFGYWTPAALAAERCKCEALPVPLRRRALAYCDEARTVAPGLPAALQLMRSEWAAYGHGSNPPPSCAAVLAWGGLPGRGLAMRAADVPALRLPVDFTTNMRPL